jgi:hypothetical protein
MRTAAVGLAFLALTGCSTSVVKASFNSNTLPPTAAPVSASGASIRVVSTGGSGAVFASMLFFGTLLAVEDSRTGALSSATSTYLYDGFWARPVPELDPDRRISEQDCSRPPDLSLGNLRCK